MSRRHEIPRCMTIPSTPKKWVKCYDMEKEAFILKIVFFFSQKNFIYSANFSILLVVTFFHLFSTFNYIFSTLTFVLSILWILCRLRGWFNMWMFLRRRNVRWMTCRWRRTRFARQLLPNFTQEVLDPRKFFFNIFNPCTTFR